MAPRVCVTSFRLLFYADHLSNFNRRRGLGLLSSAAPVVAATYTLNSWNLRSRNYCSHISETDEDSYEYVHVEYVQGMPHLTIPLPSRNEKCEFALKPISHNVGDLLKMLKLEDRGIDRATVLNKNCVRIASTCNIESLLDDTFWIYINDKRFKVCPPPREKVNMENINEMGNVRQMVAQLYEALNVGEYHMKKTNELAAKLEDLQFKLAPLEQKKAELGINAHRRTNILTWVGLGLMSVQFGILARLTWWEYSWDIMEPVTYFVTYGTTMAMYAYYCITKQEYNMRDVRDREYLLTFYKDAKKKNFDVEQYNSLKQQIAEVQYDMRRLNDPLNLQLPTRVILSDDVPPENPPPTEKGGNSGSESRFKIPFFDGSKSKKKDS